MSDMGQGSGHGAAPGWYEDPSNPSMARWWDGERWTERSRPKDSTPPQPPPPPSAPGYQTSGYAAPSSGHGFASQASGPPPSNYLAQSILVTLFCCLPFGVVSIVKASQVNSLWQAGQVDAARSASAQARKWAWVAFGLGLTVIALYLLFFIVLAASTNSSSSY